MNGWMPAARNWKTSQIMAASKRSDCYCALMFLDLDNFKSLNDTHGHEVGDLLLIEAADRLKICVREMDTVARFGGDEFVLLLPEIRGGQAYEVVERVRAAFRESNTAKVVPHPPSPNMPICTLDIILVKIPF